MDVAELVVKAGSLGLLACVIWYFLAEVLPKQDIRHIQERKERDEKFAKVLKEITERHESAIAAQRAEFITSLRRDRRMLRRIDENTRRTAELLIATLCRQEGSRTADDLPADIQSMLRDRTTEVRKERAHDQQDQVRR
jgi:acyl-CoA reductase-like NAD-dependent aldehyde dehydrogenase